MENSIYPRIVNGFRDLNAAENNLRWKIIDAAREVYKRYGFEHLDTPLMEYAEAIGKYMPDEDTVDKGVYSFRNPETEPTYQPNGRELRESGKVVMANHPLALRYDLTAPLARHYAEHYYEDFRKKVYAEGRTPLFRRYAFGPVFRYEIKLSPGRFREFWQLDFDSVGTADVSADAEVCMILCDALEAIGLARDTFVVKVNNRKVLKGFLQAQGVMDDEQEGGILRIFDKLDKIGWEAMEQELGQGRTDSSGAPVAGLGLSEELVAAIIGFLKGFEGANTRKAILAQLESTLSENDTAAEGIAELKKIDDILTTLGFDDKRVIFDPTLIRGMAYYTGPVFEVESLLTYKDRKGKEKKVGSICGGGRYDGLVENLLGIKVPATGASIGVSRLAALLLLTEKEKAESDGPVFIAYFDDSLASEYQKMARELREVGIPTEVYCGYYKGFKKMKKQMKYADDKQCPIVILMGENEAAKGTVSVKNLKLGTQLADQISDKAEFKARVQKEVKRKDLVAYIQELVNQL